MQGYTLKQQIQFTIGNMMASRLSFSEGMKALEKEWIILVLLAEKGHPGKAAATLGVHRNSLRKAMRRLGISAETIKRVRNKESAALRLEKRRPESAAMQAGA